MSRMSDILPAGLVFALSLLVTYASFSVGDPEPYLFPRLITLGMTGLSLLALVQAFVDAKPAGGSYGLSLIGCIAPGIAVMLIYVFALTEWLGFYVSSTIAFFVLFSLYDPADHVPSVLAKRAVITAVFMVVIYCVFTLILRVQTPRGLFL